MVNVVVTTYNHKNFIAKCLDSILMQQTEFEFNIIIGEDDSSDGTREICKDYSKRYPNKIKLFLRNRKDIIYINKKPTGRFNFIENLKSCDAKYVALCDGDDYWTDSLKLQKQVSFLEQNNSYAICTHNVMELNSFVEEVNVIPGNHKFVSFDIYNYIINNKTATCSILFKREAIGETLPDWFAKVPFGDWALILIILKNSKCLCGSLSDLMGVYRIHNNGLHSQFYENKRKFREAFKQHLTFIELIREELLFESDYLINYLKKNRNIHHRLYKLNMECHIYGLALIHYLKWKLLKMRIKKSVK